MITPNLVKERTEQIETTKSVSYWIVKRAQRIESNIIRIIYMMIF